MLKCRDDIVVSSHLRIAPSGRRMHSKAIEPRPNLGPFFFKVHHDMITPSILRLNMTGKMSRQADRRNQYYPRPSVLADNFLLRRTAPWPPTVTITFVKSSPQHSILACRLIDSRLMRIRACRHALQRRSFLLMAHICCQHIYETK